MTDKHMSSQFDSELGSISTRVLEMGGLVEAQVLQHQHLAALQRGDLGLHVGAVHEHRQQRQLGLTQNRVGAPSDEHPGRHPRRLGDGLGDR